MILAKKVLIIVLVGGMIAIGFWVVESDIFEEKAPPRAKKVLNLSGDLDGK